MFFKTSGKCPLAKVELKIYVKGCSSKRVLFLINVTGIPSSSEEFFDFNTLPDIQFY